MPRRISPDPQTVSLGVRLRELRIERNMSLGDLSDVSKISKAHLSSIENGLLSINVQTISRLAKGLDVRPFYLLTAPTDDDHDQIIEFVRKLSTPEIAQARRSLTKAAKEATKAARIRNDH
jgi:transcriptional regulator with XRE-family HTH domain